MRILIIAALLLTTACAEMTTKKYITIWKHKNISDVISAYGQPDKITDLGNGEKVYEWTRKAGVNASATQWGNSTYVNANQGYCHLVFRAGAKGKLENINWDGDRC